MAIPVRVGPVELMSLPGNCKIRVREHVWWRYALGLSVWQQSLVFVLTTITLPKSSNQMHFRGPDSSRSIYVSAMSLPWRHVLMQSSKKLLDLMTTHLSAGCHGKSFGIRGTTLTQQRPEAHRYGCSNVPLVFHSDPLPRGWADCEILRQWDHLPPPERQLPRSLDLDLTLPAARVSFA